ncbi:MAG: hypothetical protein AAF078_10160, partial [Planctomycetota bacterium]
MNLAKTASRIARLLTVVAACTAGVVAADTVRLYPHAMTTSRTVELGQIAVLEGSAAEALSDVVVADWPQHAQNARISLEHVRARLTQHGVNWGLISLEGAGHCTVKLRGGNAAPNPQPTPATTPPAATPTVTPAPQVSQPQPAPAIDQSSTASASIRSHVPTLRREITARLKLASPYPAESLRITYPIEESWLDEPITGPTVLRPLTSANLGTLIIVVERLGPDGEPIDRRQIRSHIERQSVAVIAARPLRAGKTLTTDDLTATTIWLDNSNAKPLTDANA